MRYIVSPLVVSAPKLLAATAAAPARTRDGYSVHTSRFYSSGHKAWDIAVGEGAHVRAPHWGVVTETGTTESCGKTSVIQGLGQRTRYCHLSRSLFLPGLLRLVWPGATVGWSGNTGASTGPHLHVQMVIGAENTPTPFEQELERSYAWRKQALPALAIGLALLGTFTYARHQGIV